MADQQALWRRVNAIKRQVLNTIGSELSYEFRSTDTYQCYTGLCGEAQIAYEDAELNEVLIGMLTEYARKVIDLRQKNRD